VVTARVREALRAAGITPRGDDDEDATATVSHGPAAGAAGPDATSPLASDGPDATGPLAARPAPRGTRPGGDTR
jgi:hypothetical protein